MSIAFEARLKAQALGLGFDLAGIATLGPAPTHPALRAWLDQGFHGEMGYLDRGAALRADARLPEPGMRSAIVVALDYGGRSPDGPVARYARGTDYHRVMWDRLDALLAWVRSERDPRTRGRAYVDTGPVLERDLARQAGLGWFGKNTMLIHPEKGSFFFLGALFVDLELDPDPPFATEHCGSCTRCLDACPTDAFVAPGVMDARRCISYLTIESRQPFTDEAAAAIGTHVYGCDICQDVCPWNVKFAQPVREAAFAERPLIAGKDARALATELLAMDESSYRETFRDSAMTRARLSGLRRNARAVLRNLGVALALALVLAPGLAVAAVPSQAQGVPVRPDSARSAPRDIIRDTSRAPERVEAVVIAATRSGRRIEDEPLRVEVMDAEEVEEKLLMTPGDITMMLNETPGLRVQVTSPGLGGANVRVQGLRGRYTQILVDGLPLHGAQTGGLGLLQIPPIDLGGVEVIKGVSSALYGGSALGGVVNLISRRPGDGRVADALVNATTLGGTDLTLFVADRATDRLGYSIQAGEHRQADVDRDGDGWIDIPAYTRRVVRPRVFWSGMKGASVMATAGATDESRRGGTKGGALTPDGVPFREALRTERHDAGLVGQWPLGARIVTARSAVSRAAHRHDFGSVRERDAHQTAFGELAITGAGLGGIWVLGGAWQQEHYRARDVTGFDYSFETPGLFAQHTVDAGRTAISASARADWHSVYGAQLSPRLSALWRVADEWALRASVGGGFFAPTPFTEEIEAVGLSAATPLGTLRAERGRSASVDLLGAVGGVELHGSLFASRLSDAVATRERSGNPALLELVNAEAATRNAGIEVLARVRPDDFHFSVAYTHLRATEWDPSGIGRREVPLTPRHAIGALAAWEDHDRGRVGVEVYRTGVQSLADDPFRSRSEPYWHIGVLAERAVLGLRVFVNAENLLDYRQTRSAPLLRPVRGPGGRWTTDVWGPLDGRVFNIGIRR